MKAQIIFIVAAIACVSAQDTFYCPDGWELFVRTFDSIRKYNLIENFDPNIFQFVLSIIILHNIFQQREGKDGMDECSCYLFPTTLARVSHGDAQLLCSGHDA